NLVRMPGTERTTRQFDETQLPPKKRLRSDRQTPAGSPAANSLGQQLVQETLARDRAILDMQELAALERKRQRLLFELRRNGKKVHNGSSPPQQRKSTTAVPAVAESTGAEERALLSTLARITVLLAKQNKTKEENTSKWNVLIKPQQHMNKSEPEQQQREKQEGDSIAVSGYD
ncbi:hypothetical protein BOX15_Mlig003350g5, partial [Macrostomum lignano]